MQRVPTAIAKRIVWALQRHHLPRLNTRLYERSDDLPIALVDMAETGKIGIPVACCLGDDDHWTLIGTDGIAGCARGRSNLLPYAQISEIHDGGTMTQAGHLLHSELNKAELANSREPRCLKLSTQEGVSKIF